MKLLYLFGDKTKTLTEHNIFKADSLVVAYEILLDIIQLENENENIFSDKEIKSMFNSDIIDLHEGNYCRIINYDGKQSPEKVANKDYATLDISKT